MDYAQKLQPWRPASAFQEVADALNGAVEAQNCKVAPSTKHHALRASANAAERRVLDYPIPSSGKLVFVSPAGANDGADGSEARPFVSLHQAIAAIRAERAAAGVTEPTIADRATVVLRHGSHFLAQTLELGSEVGEEL